MANQCGLLFFRVVLKNQALQARDLSNVIFRFNVMRQQNGFSPRIVARKVRLRHSNVCENL